LAVLGVLQGKGRPASYAAGRRRHARPDGRVPRPRRTSTGPRRPLAAGDGLFTDDDAPVHEAADRQGARRASRPARRPTTFSPALPTTRGQVASFLTRVLDLLVESGWAPDRAAI
jgi:hypothetical protein